MVLQHLLKLFFLEFEEIVLPDKEKKSEIILQELSKTKCEESCNKRKDVLIKEYVNIVNQISTPEQLEYMEQNLTSLKPTLAALLETTKNSEGRLLQPKSNISTKKIIPQRKFFSTKKKTNKNARKVQTGQRFESLNITAVKLASVLLPAEHT